MITPAPLTRLQFWSVFLGNLFEHYDTALFAFLAPFFAPLFFSNQDPVTALMLTYGIIPLGMLVRPIGSIFFGYISNRYSRKAALFISLTGMALISTLIACAPTYQQAGMLAPIMLLAGRLIQNFFASGEIIGGAVYLLEHTHQKNHDVMSGVYSSSTVGGMLLASAAVTALYSLHLIETYWRVLYLFGCLTAVFGVFLRGKLNIGQLKKMNDPEYSLINLLQLFWRQRKIVFVVALAAGFSYACHTIALVVTNGFIPLVSKVSQEQVMSLNTALLVFDLLALPLFGWLAGRFSRQRMMMLSAAAAAALGIPLFMLLDEAVFLTVVIVRICLTIIGVWFCATFHSWSQSLLPLSQCYAVISFAYSIGSQLLGGATATISLWLFHQTGVVSSVAWYWALLGAVSCIWIARSTLPSRAATRHKGESSTISLLN
jgi:MFS family permease